MNSTDLDGLKLVTDDNNFAGPQQVDLAVESAIAQGSQGWGVQQDVAVLLSVLRDLAGAQLIAQTADENRRMLKGAQMELGRVKKQRDQKDAQLQKAREQLDEKEEARAKFASDNLALRAKLNASD